MFISFLTTHKHFTKTGRYVCLTKKRVFNCLFALPVSDCLTVPVVLFSFSVDCTSQALAHVKL